MRKQVFTIVVLLILFMGTLGIAVAKNEPTYNLIKIENFEFISGDYIQL